MEKQKCGRKPKDGTKISVILDNSLLEKVKGASKNRRISKTKIIEDSLKNYLSEESEAKNNG